MKQSLSLKLGHKLKLTPRLQQAITLLQLSSMDLETEIRTALETNPFLEETEGPSPGICDANPAASETGAEKIEAGTFETTDDGDHPASEFEGEALTSADSEIDRPPTDSESGPQLHATRDSYDASAYLDSLTGARTLADYLREQIRIAPLNERASLIASTLVENINADGYLDASIDELVAFLAPAGDISADEVEQVLAVVQSMDPPGIGARDLRECLLLQLAQMSNTTAVQHAILLVESHLEALSKRDLGAVRRLLGIDEEQLTEAMGVIRGLDPRPAARIDSSVPPYVVPDLVVRRTDDEWQVVLNEDAHSKLAISPACKTYLAAGGNREDTLYFRQRHQEAKWFLQSLRQRNQTILRVAREIMRHQEGFLEQGERAMKPLTLRQVADALELHESTVSRATSQKYILSPRGTHELKYFFSSHLASDQGDALSSTAIQAQIRALIAAESEHKPISDQKIADYFKSRGITVARRTVAKYREQMHIPPSSQRKGFL